jgi:hypothetical protein
VLFERWETFYVIVGSSAGALTGLMFVVITLIADARGSQGALEAFGTPTIVHFGAALLLSAIVTVPWPTILAAAVALALFGVGGTLYMCLVLRRARRQTDYRPVFEDWLFHSALPFAAYIVVLGAGLALPRAVTPALFVIGAVPLLLLFIGIHNAWDTVTWVVVTRWQARRRAEEEPGRSDRHGPANAERDRSERGRSERE